MKNDLSLSPLFDEFVKTLPPYGDPRDAEIAALRQQLAECERNANEQAQTLHNTICSANRLSEQLSTVTKERDEWKAEALDHCEKVVKQANAALSDRHYMRVMDEQLSELTNFAKRIASLPEHGEYVMLIDEAREALAKLGADKTGE